MNYESDRACRHFFKIYLRNRHSSLGRLWRCTDYLLRELKTLGFDTGVSETPIIPIILKDQDRMFDLMAALVANNIFVSPVVYPAGPTNQPRGRLRLMADHTLADMDRLLNVLSVEGRRLSLLTLN